MDCGKCGTANLETNKFCAECGASLSSALDPALQMSIDNKIDSALAKRLTDQRIVEIDVQEKVINRLTDLAKIVGIPIALLLALLGLWGIKSLSDVDNKVKQATNDAVKTMNSKVDAETERAITNLNKKVDSEDQHIVRQAQLSARESLDKAVASARNDIELDALGSKKRFDDLKAQLNTQAANLTSAIKTQDTKLVGIEKMVNQLTAQQVGLKFEGVRLQPTVDPAGMSYIGAGHRLSPEEMSSGKIRIGGKAIDFRAGISSEQADLLLQQDLDAIGETISRLVTVKLSSNQKQALEDFVFNMGVQAFESSSMLTELNAGHYDAVPKEMSKWTHIHGVQLPGMVLRRDAEIELWNTH